MGKIDFGNMRKKNKFTILLVSFFMIIFNACNPRDEAYQENVSTKVSTENMESDIEPVLEEIHPTDVAEAIYNYYELNIEFSSLNNGTMVDSRLLERQINLVLKIFESIENGDLSTFRSLLEPQDGSDILHHFLLIQRYFGDIVGVDFETLNDAVSEAGVALNEIENIFWNIEFPAVNRGTGLFVKEMTTGPLGWEIRAVVVDNNYREKIYHIRFGFEKINRLVRQNG